MLVYSFMEIMRETDLEGSVSIICKNVYEEILIMDHKECNGLGPCLRRGGGELKRGLLYPVP